MPRTRRPYPPEFREQLVALVRAGRTPEDLARLEFEPDGADLDQQTGCTPRIPIATVTDDRTDGLTHLPNVAEHDVDIRRENRQLKVER